MEDFLPAKYFVGIKLAVLAGAVLLVWPALLNAYPIVFSDTHAFLVQASQPRMVWDKPWVYGAFLLALHGRTTLWLPLAAQGLILSHLLWLLAEMQGRAGAARHLVLCALLAGGSAAPWFAALLMPDIFAPVTVLGLYLLAYGNQLGRWRRGWLHALAAFAIAAHLSHLVLAAGCLAVIAILRWRRLAVTCAPLLAALAILIATNLAGYGRFAVSPYGAVFALARLTADGIAGPVILRACPAAGWHMCDWANRLPSSSDDFLWNGSGPVWTAPDGPIGLAPEAGAIVARTLREDPFGVLRVALANTRTQLTMVALGDTLGPDWLDGSITGSLRAYFPPEELRRFAAGVQAQGHLAAWAASLNPPHAVLLVLGAGATLVILLHRRTAMNLRGLAALILAGLLANAVATGALSGPHDRYQARIAWLVLLPPALVLLRSARAFQPRPATSAPASRSHPAGSR